MASCNVMCVRVCIGRLKTVCVCVCVYVYADYILAIYIVNIHIYATHIHIYMCICIIILRKYLTSKSINQGHMFECRKKAKEVKKKKW